MKKKQARFIYINLLREIETAKQLPAGRAG